MSYDNEYNNTPSDSPAEASSPTQSFFQTAPNIGEDLDAASTAVPSTGASTTTSQVPPAAYVPPVPPITPKYCPPVPEAKPVNVPPAPPSTKKSGNGSKLWLIILIVALCAALIGGAIGGAVAYWCFNSTSASDGVSTDDADDNESDDEEDNNNTGDTQDNNSADDTKPSEDSNTSNNTESTGNNETKPTPSGTLTPDQVYEQNVNSTVTISCTVTTQGLFGGTSESTSTGSGFVYSTKGNYGYIVTNHHVIDSAKSITVILYDGNKLKADLLGADKANDIAVLRVEHAGLQAVTLGDSDTLRVGDTVLAIGNPLGTLPFSLTCGIISGFERNIDLGDTTMSLIQTDCPINSGNSGGAMFNLQGEVIAVVNAKSSSGLLAALGLTASVDNIGFAIPLNNVRPLIENFIANS